MRFLAAIKIRFFDTSGLYAALELLRRCDPNVLDHPADVDKAKLLIAGELIRRGEIFWE